MVSAAAPAQAEARDCFPDVEISLVLPCRDERVTVGRCVEKGLATLRGLELRGEVLVVDNGSSDGSAEVAEEAGARVVREAVAGYGMAIRRGISAARGRWVVVADADESYDLGEVGRFVDALRGGADLVIGSRCRGKIQPGAMPWLHRWIGNPVLSRLLRLLFGGNVSDAHCGMRAFSATAARRMELSTGGMEFASEMVIKALFARMRIVELPITLHPDGRGRPSHLRWASDGWRHLRLMLLLSPTQLFLVPGGGCVLAGLVPLLTLGAGPRSIGSMHFDVHYLVLGSLLTILGAQMIALGVFAKVYSHATRLFVPDRMLEAILRLFTLERGLAVGAALFLFGAAIDGWILWKWLDSGRGALDAVRPAIQASTLMIAGAQTIFSSFFLSLLRKNDDDARAR